MHVVRPVGAIVLGFVMAFGAAASAQRGPVAVPIVGSPAAQQPQPAPPAPQPPQVPRQPPAMPPAIPPPAPAAPAVTGPRKLELTFKDGTVALDAQNVTLREIFAEWQRRNGCQFVNAEKLPASPVTLQFPAGTPELVAIDSMLHGLATATTGYGYIVAPRAAQNSTASACGAVYIVASSRPIGSPTYTPAASVSGPIAAPLVTPGSPDDEIPPVVPFPPGPPPGQPRPGVMQNPPNVPGQPNPNAMPGQPNPNAPANSGGQPGGFGPVAPTAPGAGRIGAQPTPPAAPPGGGRGGQ